ncbi:MAG: hypothetical protein JXB05_28930 [Myxococcaceae bacterium]|nr:hypothetical protein [Myxococcaceae bacterium]
MGLASAPCSQDELSHALFGGQRSPQANSGGWGMPVVEASAQGGITAGLAGVF